MSQYLTTDGLAGKTMHHLPKNLMPLASHDQNSLGRRLWHTYCCFSRFYHGNQRDQKRAGFR